MLLTQMTRPSNKKRASGGAQPEPVVSLKFLAEYLNLSPATISLVINKSPAAKSIPERTKARVLRAAEKFNYRPNFYARHLSKKRTFTVGVVVPEISEGYAALVMSGVEDRLLQEGYFYFVVSHRGRQDLIDEYPRLLLDRAVEGLILVNTPLHREMTVPTVSISPHGRLRGATTIALDNHKAGWLALEHLATLGHKRIAFFKGHPGSADTESRWAGVCEAASSFGIEVRPELTLQLQERDRHPEPSTPEEGVVYARKLLEAGKEFSALLAFNDMSAIGAMRAFSDSGLRVPQDVSVVGFDDVQAAAYMIPRLTTVRQPLRRMGEAAAASLLDRIANANIRSKDILVEPELIVRESTGPPAGDSAACRSGDSEPARAKV
jgi:DNA-binding LacI/PurR family transcriptional regulator